MLPIFFITALITLLVIDSDLHISTVLNWGLLFLYISIYYALLLLLLCFGRSEHGHCSALASPVSLYYKLYHQKVSISISSTCYCTAPIALHFNMDWAIGFVCVIVWQFISHFRYRRLLPRMQRNLPTILFSHRGITKQSGMVLNIRYLL